MEPREGSNSIGHNAITLPHTGVVETHMTTDDIEELRRYLDRGGLVAGLEYLNNRVSHRFTAVYRFHDLAMNVQARFDKQNSLEPDPFSRVPITNSFCEMAMDQGHFIASDSIKDTRLGGNPYRTVLGSYVGLPLELNAGELYGTLCHYDLVGQEIPAGEFEFLQRAARLIPGYLAR